jgi:hypothetical protein
MKKPLLWRGRGFGFLLAATWLFGRAAAGEVTLESLLAEMTDREATARWPLPAYACKQASSYDRRQTDPARADSWHANQDYDQFIRTEVNEGRKEWVMMESASPGAITRFWAPLPADRGNPVVRFYLDGATTPTFSADYLSLLGGQAFARPPFAFTAWNETDLRNQLKLSAKPQRGVGGDLYLPIPFAKGCKITLDRIPFYYLINYREYRPGTAVRSFSLAGLAAAKEAVDQAGKTLLAGPGDVVKTPASAAMLAPGQTLVRELPEGPAAVCTLQVRIEPKDTLQCLRSVILQGTFDGESTLWCPLGDFFGAGVRLNPVCDWNRLVGHDGLLTARWIMPYRKTGSLMLKNVGKTAVAVSIAAETGPWSWDDASMHFHAAWHAEAEMRTRPRRDWNGVEIQGQGIYVGDTLTVYNRVKPVAQENDGSWFGEGDERFYVDGEPFPSHLGTGMEDYYGYAWGMPGYFNSPFLSAPRRDGDQGKSNWDMKALTWAGYTTTSRLRLLDGIPFRKRLKFDLELWHCGDKVVDYAIATFWYARPGAADNRPPQPGEAAAPLPAEPPPPATAGHRECEGMPRLAKSAGLETVLQEAARPFPNGAWSNNAQILVLARQPGDFLELLVADQVAGPKTLTLHATRSYDYGIVRFSVNGQPAATDFDGYASKPGLAPPLLLGTFAPRDGKLVLRIEVVGANPAAKPGRAYFGLDAIDLK